MSKKPHKHYVAHDADVVEQDLYSMGEYCNFLPANKTHMQIACPGCSVIILVMVEAGENFLICPICAAHFVLMATPEQTQDFATESYWGLSVNRN